MDSGKISGNYPTTEEIAIQSLRGLIPDIISNNERFNSNFYLLQWLKAQDLNPEKTETMIRNSVQWRQDNQIESGWKDETFLEFSEKYGFVCGVDKDRCPVVFFQLGGKDFRKGISTYGKKGWVLYWAKHYAQVEDLIFTHNKDKNDDTHRINYDSSKEITLIVDSKGFSAFQLTSLDVLRLGVVNATNITHYFPALVSLTIFVNMNTVFKGAFKVLKPILEVPYLTMEFYGSDEVLNRRIFKNLQIVRVTGAAKGDF
ncbi:unnamed protein product [Allacma fusca]|uniref:CRAL-TRIO domain-containing protein n=1 Tax=Allacma fusca TaxID=39272 RepID=A0A8J2JCD2_9HEXA|nr:unnamed protein product [Allacma fusca]